MKTSISKERSKLKVRKGYRDTEEFVFYNKTLKDWYPLNINYEYKYSMDGRDIYLTLSDSYATYYDYGVESKNRAKEAGNRFSPIDLWYNPSVREDNEQICRMARWLGVVNFNTDSKEVTWLSIEESYSNLLKVYDLIKDRLYQRAKKELDEIALNHLEVEERDRYLYLFADEKDLKWLHALSKMHVMVGLLRKVKVAEGVA